MPNLTAPRSSNSATVGGSDLSPPRFASLYWLTLLIGALVLGDLLLWSLGAESLRYLFGWTMSFWAAVIGGARFIYHALVELLEGKFGTDLALALALLAGLLLGEYWVAAEVVLIALAGESLEAITYGHTQKELRKLLELQPLVARVKRGDEVVELSLSAVGENDVVIIRPGERIPVDGEVISGRSSVDQSTLTGESLPAEKVAGSELFAGTLNQHGALEVRVIRVGQQSVLGQVLQAVADARCNKANIERLVDRMTRYFLPLVLFLAAATFVANNASRLGWLAAGNSLDPRSLEWMPTLAVLVVACPCALVLATPAAMLASLAWLARRGVLVRGGAALERLAGVTHFAFDKTGTLTDTRLTVSQCSGISGNDSERVLQLAAAAEQASEHLIARAILAAAQAKNVVVPPVVEFATLPGAGVDAQLARTGFGVPAVRILVGTRRLHEERGIQIPLEALERMQDFEGLGLSPLLVTENQSVIGVIGIGDTLRPEAESTIRELRELGIADIALLSGDRHSTVRTVANTLGIDRFAAELRPTEKANWLADWSHAPLTASSDGREVPSKKKIAMVGDGVNDAPALATADVGIALRSVGSEIAAEAADVVLLGEPLRYLPSIVKLARETVRVIRQNILLFAFAANLCGIVLTAWIMPAWSDEWKRRSPIAAALFHQLGSLLVLLNAMRLIWFDRWQASRLYRWELAISRIAAHASRRFQPVADLWTGVWRLRSSLMRLAAWGLVLAYLSQVVTFVGPDEVAVVKRFGRVQAVLGPGPHLRLPPPFDVVTREQPQRIRTIQIGMPRSTTAPATLAAIEWGSAHSAVAGDETGGNLWITGDQSLVELAATIQYRIADLKAFRFSSREPERLLNAIAESVVHETVASLPLLTSATGDGAADQELLSRGRADLEQTIAQRLQQRATSLGLGIEVLAEGVCLRDVHPPLPVVDAFRDVSSAFKERERMKNEADGYRRDALIQAAGRAAWEELAAVPGELSDEHWNIVRPALAGAAFAEITSAQAFVEQRQAIAEGDADAFLKEQRAQAAAPQLTHWRLFMDTLASTLGGKPKLLLDRDAGGRRQLFLGMPNAPPLPAVSATAEPPRDED